MLLNKTSDLGLFLFCFAITGYLSFLTKDPCRSDLPYETSNFRNFTQLDVHKNLLVALFAMLLSCTFCAYFFFCTIQLIHKWIFIFFR